MNRALPGLAWALIQIAEAEDQKRSQKHTELLTALSMVALGQNIRRMLGLHVIPAGAAFMEEFRKYSGHGSPFV